MYKILYIIHEGYFCINTGLIDIKIEKKRRGREKAFSKKKMKKRGHTGDNELRLH